MSNIKTRLNRLGAALRSREEELDSIPMPEEERQWLKEALAAEEDALESEALNLADIELSPAQIKRILERAGEI